MLDKTISQTINTIIGISPVNNGMLEFCIGMDAILEIKKVTTSSDVCKSLI